MRLLFVAMVLIVPFALKGEPLVSFESTNIANQGDSKQSEVSPAAQQNQALAAGNETRAADLLENPTTDPTWRLPTLYYDAHLEFMFIDRFELPSVPGLSLNFPTQSDSPLPGLTDQRSLGLRRAFFNFGHEIFGRSRLDLGFRPDAFNGGRIRRDFDTRAGIVRQAAPSLEFLDTYRMSFDIDQHLTATVGVVSDLAFRDRLDPALQFGLDVQFPQKFMAASVLWTNQGVQPPAFERAPLRGWRFEVMSFDGHDDRVNIWGGSPQSYDQGLRARDFYRGAALKAEWWSDLKWSALVYQVTEGISGGNINDVGAELAVEPEPLSMSYGHVLWRVVGRYKSEIARSSEEFPSMTHFNLSLATLWQPDHVNDLIFNLQYGQGAIANEDRPGSKFDLEGWQFALDYRYRIQHQLQARVSFAMEARRAEAEGLAYGGFDLGKGGPKLLRRILIGLDYNTLGSH